MSSEFAYLSWTLMIRRHRAQHPSEEWSSVNAMPVKASTIDYGPTGPDSEAVAPTRLIGTSSIGDRLALYTWRRSLHVHPYSRPVP